MKKVKKIDYREMFSQKVAEDHRIGDDILLLDMFSLDSVHEYEFVSPGNTFLEVLEGQGSISVNGNRHAVNGHCLVVYFQGQFVRIDIEDRNSVQRAAVFSDRFMEELYHSSIKFSDIRTSMIENPVIPVDGPTSRRLDLYVRTMCEIAADAGNADSLACAKFETLSLFYGPLRKCFAPKKRSRSLRKPYLSSEFFSLLKVHFRKEHRLGFYSDMLNITDRYLYVCVMSTTGRAPSYWVDFYLMLEAKKLLMENELSINQIADRLGFSGPSQFGKFFRKHEGVSSGTFRNSCSK